MGSRGMRIGTEVGSTMRKFIVCTVYNQVIKSRRLRWAGHVARMEEGVSAFKILTGKPKGKRPSGRPRRKGEDNIKGIGVNSEGWVDSVQAKDYRRVS